MHTLRALGVVVVALSSLSGLHSYAEEAGGNGPVQESNIAIAQDQIDTAAVVQVLTKVADIRATDGQRGQVGMDEILSFLPATDEEREKVLTAHPGPVPMECSGDICTVVSRGSEVQLNLSRMNNIPAWFGATLTLKLRWVSDTQLEICSLKGLQVRQIFWVAVDGAFIDAGGADGSSFVDVSLGGSYPDC